MIHIGSLSENDSKSSLPITSNESHLSGGSFATKFKSGLEGQIKIPIA